MGFEKKKQDFTIRWSNLKHAILYSGGSKQCNLCLKEKFSILNEKDNLPNKKSEIVLACPHKAKFCINNLKQKQNLPIVSHPHAHISTNG